MKDKLELDPRILEKNLEITKLLDRNSKLISQNVDLNHHINNNNNELLSLLEESYSIVSNLEWSSENVSNEHIKRIKSELKYSIDKIKSNIELIEMKKNEIK